MIHTARQSPKFMRLVRRLRPLVGESSIIDADAVATAVLERLWHATTTGAMRGDIGRFDDDVIAEMCGWLGDAGEMIAILVETEWLDEHADPAVRLLVHDWSTHAPKHVKGNVTRKGGFIDPSPIGPAPKAPPQGTGPSDTPQGTGAPNPTQPNPTKPLEASASCPTPAEPDAEPPLLVFPCVGSGAREYPVGQPLVDELSEAFPDLDVLAEWRRALAWVNGESRNRKTAKGMRRFLTGWLNRAQDRGGGPRGSPTPPQSRGQLATERFLARHSDGESQGSGVGGQSDLRRLRSGTG